MCTSPRLAGRPVGSLFLIPSNRVPSGESSSYKVKGDRPVFLRVSETPGFGLYSLERIGTVAETTVHDISGRTLWGVVSLSLRAGGP